MAKFAGAIEPKSAWSVCLHLISLDSRRLIKRPSKAEKPLRRPSSGCQALPCPARSARPPRGQKVSVKWLGHDEATRRENTRLIDEFLDLRVVPDHSLTWRDVPVKNLRRAHVEELLGRFIATPHKAKHLLVAIRKLVYVGLRQDWIDTDPTASVEWRPAYTGWKAWPRQAMEQFERQWPVGTSARTCYGLALWLGNRRGDVAGLRWDQRVTHRVLIDGVEHQFDGFDIVQAKNKGRTGGKRLFVR